MIMAQIVMLRDKTLRNVSIRSSSGGCKEQTYNSNTKKTKKNGVRPSQFIVDKMINITRSIAQIIVRAACKPRNHDLYSRFLARTTMLKISIMRTATKKTKVITATL